VSAVEGIFLNPVEAAADEQEFFAIPELKLHVDFVTVYGAIEHELALRGLLKSEISLRVLSPPKGPPSRGKNGFDRDALCFVRVPVSISSTFPT